MHIFYPSLVRLCVSVKLFLTFFMCWMINIECSIILTIEFKIIILLVTMCFVCFSDADPFHVFFVCRLQEFLKNTQ